MALDTTGEVSVASCTDGTKNGDETDIDCGGSCGSCSDGGACATAVDCQGGVCTDAVCAAPACDDTVLNGNETAVDCGGADCGACPNQSPCLENTDCTSGLCDSTSSLCVDPGCTDTLLNGQETDVDCGGPDCAPCGEGFSCFAPADCASGVCTGGTPALPASWPTALATATTSTSARS